MVQTRAFSKKFPCLIQSKYFIWLSVFPFVAMHDFRRGVMFVNYCMSSHIIYAFHLFLCCFSIDRGHFQQLVSFILNNDWRREPMRGAGQKNITIPVGLIPNNFSFSQGGVVSNQRWGDWWYVRSYSYYSWCYSWLWIITCHILHSTRLAPIPGLLLLLLFVNCCMTSHIIYVLHLFLCHTHQWLEKGATSKSYRPVKWIDTN